MARRSSSRTSSGTRPYSVPRSKAGQSADPSSLWPKQWSLDGETLTLVREWSIDGTEYRVEHEFTRTNPGAPDFGDLLGWLEYTGKESGFEDFIHFGPMDTISAYGFDDRWPVRRQPRDVGFSGLRTWRPDVLPRRRGALAETTLVSRSYSV